MTTFKYLTAVLMLMLILGMTACGQGQPAVDQIEDTSAHEPTATAPTVAIVESPTVANPTPDIDPTVVAAIAAVESRTNPTPNIAQTVAAAIAAASPTATPTVPPLALTSSEAPRPTPWSRPTLAPRTPFPTLTPIPAPIIPPTRKQALQVPAKPDWSVENDAAFDYRSITSADKTQRWTCVGANRPRINITHPAAHTVATAVTGRTAEDKDTVINGELYKLAWAAWSSNPAWTPEEHALNVRHDQALQLKRALVSSGAESFSVSIGTPPVEGHYSTDGLMGALTENEMECFN